MDVRELVAVVAADVALAAVFKVRGDEGYAVDGKAGLAVRDLSVDALGVFGRVLAGYLAAAAFDELRGIGREIGLKVEGVDILRRDVDADQPVILRRGSVLAQHGAARERQGEGEYEHNREFLHVVSPK